MTSPEFHIARITAQSKNADPKHIRGGVPEITPDDIRAATSLVSHPALYHALMTKYAASEISSELLLEMLIEISGNTFLRENQGTRITGKINQRLCELAVMDYMDPECARNRTDSSNARHCGVDVKTYKRHYKDHHQKLAELLFLLQSEGVRRFNHIMRRDDD